ncbi:MAG: hypothetical protein H6740_23840 [Alphaproteobacteria bacterium]|nr:hypothetical protein [Alphaproteobacteria bacterium]
MSSSGRGKLAVVVQRLGAGLHSGVIYKVDQEPERFLHLLWHLKLRNEAPPSEGVWVQCTVQRAKKQIIVQRAARLAERYGDGSLGFGFALDGVRVLDDGTVDLGGGSGLTCSAFVHVLFRDCGAALVNVDTYAAQRSDAEKRKDRDAQQALVHQLRSDGHGPQADRAQAEVGSARIRPEEIAGASGLRYRPVELRDAEAAGQHVRSFLP